MTKYVFGVMSSKYSLEAPGDEVAFVCMALYFSKDLPIAVYEPVETAFMALDVLTKYQGVKFKPDVMRACLGSVKSVDL
ncbi:MAG: hypothetical protein WC307_06210 [Candidatus Nanoarchaeia archaeon]|jgi:DNA mismatch repair protein MutH